MIPSGLCIDAFGVRRVVAAGGIVMGLGTGAMALAGAPSLLFAGRFAVGLGATVTFIGALKIAATWFPPARFGFLSAVTATIGVLGALAALVGLAGGRGALGIIGVATLAASALCLGLVRDRPEGGGFEAAPVAGL